MSATESFMLLIFLTAVFYVFTFTGSKHRNLINHLNLMRASSPRYDGFCEGFFLIHLLWISIQPDRIIFYVFLNKTILFYTLEYPRDYL